MIHNTNFKSEDIRRGDVLYAQFGEENIMGYEQKGDRPVVVVQNDIGNKYSGTTIVALVTTSNKKEMPTHMRLSMYGLERDSTIMFEHLRTIDKNRLRWKINSLNPSQMEELDSKLSLSLGLTMRDYERGD